MISDSEPLLNYPFKIFVDVLSALPIVCNLQQAIICDFDEALWFYCIFGIFDTGKPLFLKMCLWIRSTSLTEHKENFAVIGISESDS